MVGGDVGDQSTDHVSGLQSLWDGLEHLQNPGSTKLSGFPGKEVEVEGFTDQLNLDLNASVGLAG